jgi:hypothetical protein
MEMSVPERARGKGVNASIRRERGREREREHYKRWGVHCRRLRRVAQLQPEAQPHVYPESEAQPRHDLEPQEDELREELVEENFQDDGPNEEAKENDEDEEHGSDLSQCTFIELELDEFPEGPKDKTILALYKGYIARYINDGYVTY